MARGVAKWLTRVSGGRVPTENECPVPRKRGLRRVDAVCKEFDMDPETAFDFRDYLHECKDTGDLGTSNERGDFTMDELREKAREFLGLE
jgi:hypothetical protein